MTLKKQPENLNLLLEEWPFHFYETADPDLREKLIAEQIERYHLEEDTKRSEVFHSRYDFSQNEPADLFMQAWLMLKIESDTKPSFLNRASKKRILEKYAGQLHLFEANDPYLQMEWKNFAMSYIRICCENKSYGTVAFGLYTMKDEWTANKLAAEIDAVTGIYPAYFDSAKLFAPLRKAMIEAYTTMIENGEQLWQRYIETH